MDMRTQKGRSRTGARCDLACVFAAIVIVGLSGAAGQIYTVNSPWFELSIGPDVGTHFNLTFFNALGNSSLSNKVSFPFCSRDPLHPEKDRKTYSELHPERW